VKTTCEMYYAGSTPRKRSRPAPMDWLRPRTQPSARI
jgi:hypothetical protein